MRIIKNILAVTLLLLGNVIFAQQESTFTFYKYHMNMVNPAYVGVNNETLLTSSLRRQWTGVKDAPSTQAISFGTSLGNNLGIGVSIVSDKTFIESQTVLGIDFSYKLKLSEAYDLYFGIKAGGNFYDINISGLQNYLPQSDPVLLNVNYFNPNVGIGALLQHKKYFVSLSIPRILNTKRAKEKDGIAITTTDRPHIYFSSGYDFDLNPEASLVLKPSLMLSYVNGMPVSLNINTMLQIQKYFEIGASYRTEKAFAGLIDFTINKRMMIGYTYEISTISVLASTKNTNEFIIRFKF